MREFRKSFYEELVRGGLTSARYSPKNSGRALELFNAKVVELPDGLRRLVPYEPVEIPFDEQTIGSYLLDLKWPHPQIIRGKKHSFLCDRQAIYYLDEYDYSLTPIDIYDITDTSSLLTIQPGNQWQLIDFYDTWYLTNGMTMIWHSGIQEMLGGSDVHYGTNGMRVQCACGFRGRSWIGGFESGYFWNSGWKEYYDYWTGQMPDITDYDPPATNVLSLTAGDPAENMVFYSTIGGADLLMFLDPRYGTADQALFYGTRGIIHSRYGRPTSAPLIDLSDHNQFILDMFRRNEMGFMPMPWQGKVTTIKPLGPGVIVYGDGGVSALVPQDKYMQLVEFDDLREGINNVGAVGGNENEHVFVDSSTTLWRIGADLKPQRLGFDNHLSNMAGTEIIVSADVRRREYYICNGYLSYQLTSSGLSQHGQILTSLINTVGGLKGFGIPEWAIGGTDREFRLETDTFDMREPGNKTIAAAEVSQDLDDDPYQFPTNPKMYASLKYRTTDRSKWQTRPERLINDNGEVFLQTTAKDFRLKLRASDFRDVNLSELFFRFQLPDKRFRRGVDV